MFSCNTSKSYSFAATFEAIAPLDKSLHSLTYFAAAAVFEKS